MPRLEYLLAGTEHVEARVGKPPKSRLPRNHGPSENRKASMGWQTPNNIMLCIAACTGFPGFLQVGEFTVLSVQCYDREVHWSFSDLAMECHTAPSLFHIRREPFKTDPFRQGADIFLGATNTSTSVRTFAQPKDQCMIPEAGRG